MFERAPRTLVPEIGLRVQGYGVQGYGVEDVEPTP